MDLPDCPPGAEGYEDSVVEVPKKPGDDTCTKAEQEFQEHLNSLKIKVEDGETRCMVERRGRDVSGKWIYLCYPCAAMCSGESILQTHISGKKHKTKLAIRTVWPKSIFDDHPYFQGEKSGNKGGATEKILQKMAEEVDLHNKGLTELERDYNRYKNVRCHLQDSLDSVKTPLLGLEYLIEHPPEEAHYEPTYVCTLCTKQGYPRTIINHITCFWHRYNYLVRHFSKACSLLSPYRSQSKYREGVGIVMNRLAQRIEDKYGRMRPVNIDKEIYEKEKERIHQWLFRGHHFSENDGNTFEEVVDIDLINSLHKSNENLSDKLADKRDPSPPIVAAPSRPHFNNFTRRSGRQQRRVGSAESLSDISDDEIRREPHTGNRDAYDRPQSFKSRYEPFSNKNPRHTSPPLHRYNHKRTKTDKEREKEKMIKPPNYIYKVKLAEDKRLAAEDSAKKALAYHEKNPEKHPLYPEEWKKFWNKRYKEIQAEGKDPSKHDFKPEWIVYWTARMKELHDEELRVTVHEIYRKMCLSPPGTDSDKQKSPDPKRKSPDPKRRSPDLRRRSPDHRRRSPDPRRRSPDPRRRSPDPRRRSPVRRRSSERRRSPPRRRELERDRRSPGRRRTPDHRRSPPRLHSERSRSPLSKPRSPIRMNLKLESIPRRTRSRSPLSRREAELRNRSPGPHPHHPHHALAPSLQTVLISDDDLKADDGLSPWNSANSLESLGSLPDARSPPPPRSRAASVLSARTNRSRRDYARDTRDTRDARDNLDPQDLGPAENVVATLRMLVALEDYLGSLGPKIVDLLTEALKMEKERANSSEELLERETAVVLIETAKEKLKGAAQAGLVAPAATAAVRAAVLRAASTLHLADKRAKQNQQESSSSKVTPANPVPVAGVGSVDRAQIAKQMAAALIAQGKTDVSSEELAQLVDAVVGMAEAKKREAQVKKRPEPQPAPAMPKQLSGTASALQMLQSAYDENDKNKIEKEDAPDAMDGLSDSDLETLLKNFNELSAEEQHSLIAYLKKLEAREPQRVERLRQYVSAAANVAPVEEKPPEVVDVEPVPIESDDDDYTVEEVFMSATQKVKEDQIRQEMEIVKKSLEESNTPKSVEPDPPASAPPKLDLIKNMSSATDLLALVQASIQSQSSGAPMSNVATPSAEVVTSSSYPRSFGDLPEAPMASSDPIKPLLSNMQWNSAPQIQQNSYQKPGGLLPPPQHSMVNFGGNRNIPNDSYDNSNNWNQRPMQNMPDDRGSSMQNMGDNRGSPFMQNISSNNRGPLLQNMPDNRGFMQNMGDNRGPFMQNMGDNRGPPMHNMSDNRGPLMQNMPDNRGPPMRGGFNNFGRDMPFNQGQDINQYNKGNFMNGRIQDNYDTRPNNPNQQFGNYEQNNFRGRGGGRGRGMRGRGRGYF